MDNRAPSLPLPVPDKVRHILDDEILGLVQPQNANDVIDQIAPLRTLEPLLSTRFREGLTGKTGAQDVVGRHRRQIKRTDVAMGSDTEILFVERSKVVVALTREDAIMTECFEGEVKTAESGE